MSMGISVCNTKQTKNESFKKPHWDLKPAQNN